MNQADHKPSAPSHVQRHFKAHQRSGLSIKAYCERHSVSLSTFHYWRKRYQVKQTIPSNGKMRPEFLDMGTLGLSRRACEVHFPGGVKVTIHPGTSSEHVDSVLRVVAELGKC